jgi:uncharacterized protein (DUF1697 family)
MRTFVALLRGINVSGRKQIRMASLKASCEALGLESTTTYLQSGNVVFRASQSKPKDIANRLSTRIERDFGHKVEVLVLSEEKLRLIGDSNPWWPRLGGDEKLYHGTFLFDPVSEARFRQLELPARPGEQAAMMGGLVYLYCPHGYGKTKLNNSFFEKALGTRATTRNWRTILALRDLCAKRPTEAPR